MHYHELSEYHTISEDMLHWLIYEANRLDQMPTPNAGAQIHDARLARANR